MASFSPDEVRVIEAAYDRAGERIENLNASNAIRESDLRKQSSGELVAHQQQIESAGFFQKSDFSEDELAEVLTAAYEIDGIVDALEDSHDIVVMELSADMADLIQKLGLESYAKYLNLHWLGAKRSNPLPRVIPDDVRDEYSISLYNKVHGRLNQVSFQIKKIIPYGCLNIDDYNADLFPANVLDQSKHAAKEATDNYLMLQQLKAEERAAREASSISIAGEIWAIVGWDSPADFVMDMGLTAATLGASKIVRWGIRLNKAKKRLGHAVETIERGLRLDSELLRWSSVSRR